jgi:hypothetical protein
VSAADWNWKLPVELQDVPWDCAAASLTWALNAYGHAITEAEVVAGLGPSRITPTYGLMDASGAGVVAYLAELGIPALNDSDVTWQEAWAAAGHQPMIMGGRAWCHWTGVRMASLAYGRGPENYILLANPAPGYMAIGQYIEYTDFEDLGPFSAVWFPT